MAFRAGADMTVTALAIEQIWLVLSMAQVHLSTGFSDQLSHITAALRARR
jgi:hypothetical protein